MRSLGIAAVTVAVVAFMWLALYRASRVGRTDPPPPDRNVPPQGVVVRGRHAKGDLRIDPTVEITPAHAQHARGGVR